MLWNTTNLSDNLIEEKPKFTIVEKESILANILKKLLLTIQRICGRFSFLGKR